MCSLLDRVISRVFCGNQYIIAIWEFISVASADIRKLFVLITRVNTFCSWHFRTRISSLESWPDQMKNACQIRQFRGHHGNKRWPSVPALEVILIEKSTKWKDQDETRRARGKPRTTRRIKLSMNAPCERRIFLSLSRSRWESLSNQRQNWIGHD